MISLQDAISEDDRVSSMLMSLRSAMHLNRILVLVEGTSDIRFFNTHRVDNRIRYDSPESGKKEVISFVRTLRVAGNEAVYGVCDADFDRLSDIHHEGIYYTDAHDLEMMLVEGGMVDKFIMHFARSDLTDGSLAAPFCLGIKQSIMSACYRLGLLKWYNYLNQTSLNFKKLNYSLFVTVDEGEVTVDEEAYIEHILARSRNAALNVGELQNEMRRLDMMAPDQYAICNGHDFNSLLKMMFDTPLSVKNSMRIDEVESYLRMSYNREIFSTTALHGSLSGLLSRH